MMPSAPETTGLQILGAVLGVLQVALAVEMIGRGLQGLGVTRNDGYGASDYGEQSKDEDHVDIGVRSNIGRTVVSTHRYVVSADSDERRPDVDVGDAYVLVVDQLRIHHLPGVPEAA
jgi:hypothetical protein